MLNENNFEKEQQAYAEFVALTEEEKDVLVKELADIVSKNNITSIFNRKHQS